MQVFDFWKPTPRSDILPVSEPLYARALQLYRERPGKEWGLTDCVSFLVMRDRRSDKSPDQQTSISSKQALGRCCARASITTT